MKAVYVIACFVIFSCFLQNCESSIRNEIEESANLENVVEAKMDISDFVEYQDSLRKVLLDMKTNKNLKSSVLQELYIRGLVVQVNQTIEFNLPFDLHSFDCGAPDCYSTDITFKIPASNPINFPSKIRFKLNEYGCEIDEEIVIEGIFDLVEESPAYINYYSDNTKGSLIVLRDEKSLYYFPNVRQGIKVNEIEALLKSIEEDITKADQIPYQSTVMVKNEYEAFLGN